MGMLAAFALAFSGCKEEVLLPEEQPEVKAHVATVTLQKTDETKTYLVEDEENGGAYYLWNADDAQFLHVYENGVEGTINSFTLSDDSSTATLSVSFGANPGAPYEYKAIYGTLQGELIQIQANQYPKTNSFDPAADILVSKPNEAVERQDELTFYMGRPITVNKMTLIGLDSDETIGSVEFTLNKVMTGHVQYGSNQYWTGGTGNSVTLYYDENTGVVDNTGKFPVYFISAPVSDAAIEGITVLTDKHIYKKEGYTESTDPFYGRQLSFSIGRMKRFNMDLTGYSQPVAHYVVFDFSNLTVPEGNLVGVYSETKQDITVAFTSGSISYMEYNHAIYTYGGTITVSCPTAKKIVGVDFTLNPVSNYLTSSEGSFDGASWTGQSRNVGFTYSGSTMGVHIQKMTVFYEDVQLYSVNKTVDPGETTPGGQVWISPTGLLEAGTEVSLALIPNSQDYVLDKLYRGTVDVTDQVTFSLSSGLRYTFTMPAENVDITALFKRVDGVGSGRSGYSTGGQQITWGN
jgi:hypothetical protein